MRSSIIRSFLSPNSKREQKKYEGIWPQSLMACLTLNSFLKRSGIFHASLISSMEQAFYIEILSILLFDFLYFAPGFNSNISWPYLPTSKHTLTSCFLVQLLIGIIATQKLFAKGWVFLCFVWQRSHRPTSISRNLRVCNNMKL
jgi:hypothetical protein